MSQATRSPGDIVEARCTRCRTVTNHTIVALVETRIARVECNTCGGIHNYHPPKAAPAKTERKAPAKKVRSAKTKPDADFAIWQERCSSAEPAEAVPYAMDRAFREDELVAHPVFGIGLVTAVQPPNKVEVLFREGRKLLRCAL